MCKEIGNLNKLSINIYRMQHSATAKYTLLSGVHCTFPKIDLKLGHNITVIKSQKTEIL